MNFLLVNDDGINSEGIFELAKALSEQGTLFLCAPNKQQSGKSHSITLSGSIQVEETEFEGAAKAWKVDGTPADCTKIGLQMCEADGVKIDIVFSGVNKGSNLGGDTLYSGTVGAAMEGCLLGYRAIAASVNGHEATHFDTACHIAIQCIPKVMEMEPGIVININTPDLPKEELKGIKYSALGPSYFVDGFVQKQGTEYVLEGSIPDYAYLGEDIDAGANALGFATVTPLKYDFTDFDALKTMRDWGLEL